MFADRGSDDRAAEVAAVGDLAENLGNDEGVLIYPEGTRFSARKRERALAKIEASGDADRLARARALASVLPPRLGGPLELLRRAPDTDAVFCAHSGLEGSMSFADMFNGGLVGRTVRVSFWTVPAAEIPDGDRERELWLYRQWRRVDEFVARAS